MTEQCKHKWELLFNPYNSFRRVGCAITNCFDEMSDSEIEARLNATERHVRYLPIVCHLCGRLRVEYDIVTGEIKCEKCGADAEVMNDAYADMLEGK